MVVEDLAPVDHAVGARAGSGEAADDAAADGAVGGDPQLESVGGAALADGGGGVEATDEEEGLSIAGSHRTIVGDGGGDGGFGDQMALFGAVGV